MAPVNPPSWQQAGSYPARLDRLVIAGLLTPAASVGPIAARSGVRPAPAGSAMDVIPRGTADMYITVNPGTCFITATSPLGGTYECHNDAPYDVLLATANASLPRKDLIVARVYDSFDDIGSRNELTIEAVRGTPNAVPVAPALPAGAVPLGQVTVPASVTTIVSGNIADLRPFAVALGGILPVTGQTQRDALSPYAGMKVYRQDTGATETYSGAGWDGGPAYSSDFVSSPASYTTDSTFVEYTNAQWPYVEVPCPASGAVAVTLRVEGYNSSTVSSSFRFGAVMKDMTAGGGNIVSPSTNRGPCLIRSVANVTTAVVGTDRYILGGSGELAGLAGHTLRLVPAWYMSSHVNPSQGVNTGRMHVELLDRKFVAL